MSGLFPRIVSLRQRFHHPFVISIRKEIDAAFERTPIDPGAISGKRIAVAVGSRGISSLAEIVHSVIERLQKMGATPFLVPAMGSHGGATPRGQLRVLEGYGVSAENLGVEVAASMDTEYLGMTQEGIPVRVDRIALEADGIVLINRVKPHTDFKGSVGSGLLKMMAVGLGNAEGARDFHSWTRELEPGSIIRSKAKLLLETGKVVFGVAVIENAYHEIASLEIVSGSRILEDEKGLLVQARNMMPSLPVGEADILVIDQIGKDISGTGMDPNITGRWFKSHSTWQEEPRISRIVVCRLTEKTAGNALGMGLADFCTQKLVDAIDWQTTYTNAVTAQNTLPALMPISFENDRRTLEKAIESLGSRCNRRADIRLLRIRNTLDLTEMWVSEALLSAVRDRPNVAEVSEAREIVFDEEGFLEPL
jgi:hypothetical protein